MQGVEHKCSKLDRDVLALLVHLGGLGLSNPCHEVAREHASSIQVTSPLVEHIVAQTHQVPDKFIIKSGCQAVKHGKAEELSEIAENLKQIICSMEDQASSKISARKRLLCMAHSSSPSRTGFQPQ